MATITNPETIKCLLQAKGKEEGGTWERIYKYTNSGGGQLFAIISDAKYDDMYQSPYVFNPVLLMEREFLTQEGAAFLGVDQKEFNGESGGKKFYRTVIQVEVLSDSPYNFDSLKVTAYDIDEGDCSGVAKVFLTEEVDAKRMAELLEAQGSDPAFLLDEEDLETLDERLQ